MKTINIFSALILTLISHTTASPTPEPGISLDSIINAVEGTITRTANECKICVPKCKPAVQPCADECDGLNLSCTICVAKHVRTENVKTCVECLAGCSKDLQRQVAGVVP